MSTTRVKIVRRTSLGDEPLSTVEHRDSTRQGPTIGPVSLNEASAYFWLGETWKGEPIPFGVGQSIVITCEYDP